MIFTKISLVFLKPWIYDDDREIVTAQKPFQKGWTENMRKKSHISLARYIVNNMEDNDLKILLVGLVEIKTHNIPAGSPIHKGQTITLTLKH